VREGWDDRILEEMDKIGLWDAGDKHRLKEVSTSLMERLRMPSPWAIKDLN
jgi:hypothetical protein